VSVPASLTNAEWDALCDGCGLCCRITVDEPTAALMCPGYDCDKRECGIYDSRLGKHACIKLTPELIMPLHKRGTLPDSCGYVAHMLGVPKLEPDEFVCVPFSLASRKFQRDFHRDAKKYQRNSETILNNMQQDAAN